MEEPDSDSPPLTEIAWRAPDALQYFSHPSAHLPLSAVLRYFALSPFWDNQSSNAVLMMQSLSTGAEEEDPSLQQERLRLFRGVEFQVSALPPSDGGADADDSPTAYLVTKSLRTDPETSTVVQTYFILASGTVFQSSSFENLYSARLRSMITGVLDSLDILNGAEVQATECKKEQDGKESASDDDEDEEDSTEIDKQAAFNRALRGTIHRLALRPAAAPG